EAELAGVFDLEARASNGELEHQGTVTVEEVDLRAIPEVIAPPPTSSSLYLIGGRDSAAKDVANSRKNVAKVLSQHSLQEALNLVHLMDPIGVAARNLRECLLLQLHHHAQLNSRVKTQNGASGTTQLIADCIAIVDVHIKALQNKQYKEIGRAIGRPLEAVMQAFDFIRT